MITSLDGYVADATGRFDWAAPDEELHTFINEVTAPVGTYLSGHVLDWARTWQAADKVVYSTTLERIASARTRLERRFDPGAVAQLKATSAHDLTVERPGLAAAALQAGLVDEIAQYLSPAVVGGGTPFYPDGLRLDLELRDERRFGNGVVYVTYEVRS